MDEVRSQSQPPQAEESAAERLPDVPQPASILPDAQNMLLLYWFWRSMLQSNTQGTPSTQPLLNPQIVNALQNVRTPFRPLNEFPEGLLVTARKSPTPPALTASASENGIHVNAQTRDPRKLDGSGRPKPLYVCSHCGRGFTKAYNRTIHERTHTDERPFSCQVCSRRFRRKDHLRDHSYTHLTRKPFTCDICQRGFCQARSLENHRKINHLQAKQDDPKKAALDLSGNSA